jgi:hypothetical protein
MITFDPPAGAAGTIGTYSALVTDFGAVAGYYIDTNIVCHAFLRTPDGKFIVYEAPSAGTAPDNGYTTGTFVESVNVEGATTGFVVNNDAETHAWMRDSKGKVITFSVPGQIVVPGSDLGSTGKDINALGVIAGRWHDANYVTHAYVRIP